MVNLKLLSLSSLHMSGTALGVIREISYNWSIGVQYERWAKGIKTAFFLSFSYPGGSKCSGQTGNRHLRQVIDCQPSKRIWCGFIICRILFTAYNRIKCCKPGITYQILITISIRLQMNAYVIPSFMGIFWTDMRLSYQTNKLVLIRKPDFTALENMLRKMPIYVTCRSGWFFITESKDFVRHIWSSQAGWHDMDILY